MLGKISPPDKSNNADANFKPTPVFVTTPIIIPAAAQATKTPKPFRAPVSKPLIIAAGDMRVDFFMLDTKIDKIIATNAARIGDGVSTFIVRCEGGDLICTWSLYAFAPSAPDTPPPPGRNWNITWSLQWGDPASADGKFTDVLDLRAECAECACAQATENFLKKWVRTRLASAKEGDVFAVAVEGGRFCRRAGHLDRGRKKDLPHWDLPALREFARWANRQLRKSGAGLVLTFGKGE